MSRFVTVYTPSYAIEKYKVVFDSRKKAKRDRKFKDAMAAADYYEGLPSEDPSTKVFYVADSLSNSRLLEFLNKTMEIATNKWIDSMNERLKVLHEEERSFV